MENRAMPRAGEFYMHFKENFIRSTSLKNIASGLAYVLNVPYIA